MPDRLSRPALRRLEEAHVQLQIARKQLAPTDPEAVDRLTEITADVEALVRMLEAMEDDEDWHREKPEPDMSQ